MPKTVKIVVSGDGGVGKTSFLNRLIYNHFDEEKELTRGVDFYSKIIQVNGTEYNFILWDFGGQKRFSEIVNNFVDGSLAAFILFDLSRLSTIDSVLNWINKLKELGNIPILLLGNKFDLMDRENIKLIDDYIEHIAEQNENIFEYIKISSKTSYNINQAFFMLINKISQTKL
jgi:small GTP-binding protein